MPRQQVEIWFRTSPPLPIQEMVVNPDPVNYRIVETGIRACEIGPEIAGLAWLVGNLIGRNYLLTDGTNFRPGDGDLIIVPGSKIVMELLRYPGFPYQMFGLNVLALGNNRYAILLGPYLRNGPLHPCYCQIDQRETARVVGYGRSDQLGHPE